VSWGVPQGSYLGTLLFNIVFNIVVSLTIPRRVLFFADDAKIFFSIPTMNDCIILQRVLDEFINWFTFELSLNTGKCSHGFL